jgi:hypothetical protein
MVPTSNQSLTYLYKENEELKSKVKELERDNLNLTI